LSEARPIVVTLAGIVAAVGLVHAMHQCGKRHALGAPSFSLDAKHVRFTLHKDGRLQIDPRDHGPVVESEIVHVDDEGVRRTREDASFDVDIAHDALDITFAPSARDAGVEVTHGVRLALEGRAVFVSGRGEVGDLAHDTGILVVVEDAAHPLGFVADGDTMGVDVEPGVGPERKSATLRVTTGNGHLTLIAGRGAHTSALWSALFARAKVETVRVKGSVTGAQPSMGTARVVALDSEGAPQLRVPCDASGHFDFPAPKSITSFYASASGNGTRTSAPVMYAPGTPWDLRLDVSDGGELHVRAIDGETHQPITARLVVHGVDGTLDPSFGPDYRASGAGPIIDALRGDVTTPLPAGRYRVAATKGIEWSIDTHTVEVAPGKRIDVDLELRHVVPTPGEIGCDFHVHARPSFDAPVTPEDRVLSLVASGIDFAVPSEHNLVGNYGPAIKVLALEGEIAFVPGVEVTTYYPKFGHFGVFPYATDKPPPPFKNTDVEKLFNAVHADPRRTLVVNHPRLTREIGFFTAQGWKAGGPIPIGMRKDFDAVEVLNGYESASLDRVDIVLQDYYALLDTGRRYAATGSSDSHRIQYQWAGYPRTMVRVATTDGDAVVNALKAGRATVTDGPVLELELEHVQPGGEVTAASRTVLGRLVVRAAPWVDVTSATIVLGGHVVQKFDIPTRPLTTGLEPGTLEEAAARTVRLDAEVRIDAPADPTWVLATARGTRPLDDILPFMPVQPFAATNPIYVVGKGNHM
jgi:hypothetical protein